MSTAAAATPTRTARYAAGGAPATPRAAPDGVAGPGGRAPGAGFQAVAAPAGADSDQLRPRAADAAAAGDSRV